MFFVYKFSVFQGLKQKQKQKRKFTQGFKYFMNNKFYSNNKKRISVWLKLI
jgi:hypothetical protein